MDYPCGVERGGGVLIKIKCFLGFSTVSIDNLGLL